MNTKELGRWRKLWTKPSPSWELLPLSTRGLGDELLRYCDDQGRITLGGLDPVVVVCRMLRAHPHESRWIRVDLERLLADGFLTVEDGCLCVRNFTVAQAGVTESGERMRTLRARVATAGETPPAGAESGPSGGRVGAESGLSRGRVRTESPASRAATSGNDSVSLRHSDASREEKREEKREEASPCARPAPTHAREDPPPVEPSRPAEPTPEAFELLAAITEGAKATPGAWDHRAASSTIVAFVRGLRESQRTRAELVLLGAFLASPEAAKELHRRSFSPDWFVVRRADGEWDTRRIDWAMRAAREWQSRVRSSTPRRDAPSPLPSGLDRTGLPVFRRPTAPARAPAPTGGEP